MNILEKIISHKRTEVGNHRFNFTMGQLREQSSGRPAPPKFADALCAAPIGLIAEVKHKSPSAGVIRDPFNPAAIAADYEAAGAQCVSVLMDREFFGGGEEDFQAVRDQINLPMLYKEFVVDPWQVWHAKKLGASAVLLIAAAMPETLLAGLMAEIRHAGLEVLFEVHNEEELKTALKLDAPLIGINNRNLKTFETSLETTLRLLPRVGKDIRVISESGIRTREDVERLRDAGAAGILVGEQLLRQPDLQAAVRELMGT
jgi:indole-3-glycerol phosphate synthase